MQRLFKCSYDGCGELFFSESECLKHEEKHKDNKLALGYKLYITQNCDVVFSCNCGLIDKTNFGKCYIDDLTPPKLPAYYTYYEKANQQQDALKILKEYIKENIAGFKRMLEQDYDRILKNLETLEIDDGEM